MVAGARVCKMLHSDLLKHGKFFTLCKIDEDMEIDEDWLANDLRQLKGKEVTLRWGDHTQSLLMSCGIIPRSWLDWTCRVWS